MFCGWNVCHNKDWKKPPCCNKQVVEASSHNMSLHNVLGPLQTNCVFVLKCPLMRLNRALSHMNGVGSFLNRVLEKRSWFGGGNLFCGWNVCHNKDWKKPPCCNKQVVEASSHNMSLHNVLGPLQTNCVFVLKCPLMRLNRALSHMNGVGSFLNRVLEKRPSSSLHSGFTDKAPNEPKATYTLPNEPLKFCLRARFVSRTIPLYDDMKIPTPLVAFKGRFFALT